jgi:hypothetical protein
MKYIVVTETLKTSLAYYNTIKDFKLSYWFEQGYRLVLTKDYAKYKASLVDPMKFPQVCLQFKA